MEVNLDEVFIAHGQQAVALDVLSDVVVDGVLGQIVPLNEQLGIKLVFQHDKILDFRSFFGAAPTNHMLRRICIMPHKRKKRKGANLYASRVEKAARPFFKIAFFTNEPLRTAFAVLFGRKAARRLDIFLPSIVLLDEILYGR